MTTREEQLKKIREACIAANQQKFVEAPRQEAREAMLQDGLRSLEANGDIRVIAAEEILRPRIHLADFLLAFLQKHGSNAEAFFTDFDYGDGSLCVIREGSLKTLWDLRADDLEAQSDEKIALLADLLK